MHDSPDHNPTYLPKLLESLKSQGYTMVALSDLARLGAPVNEPLTLGSDGLGHGTSQGY
jgi:peptidoglycan/xylan/chitin deacetylase (PgdA/CDA1 family)